MESLTPGQSHATACPDQGMPGFLSLQDKVQAMQIRLKAALKREGERRGKKEISNTKQLKKDKRKVQVTQKGEVVKKKQKKEVDLYQVHSSVSYFVNENGKTPLTDIPPATLPLLLDNSLKTLPPIVPRTDELCNQASSVWKGFIYLPRVVKFLSLVRPVSGSCNLLRHLLPDTLHVSGRLAPEAVVDYLEKLKPSSGNGWELLVVEVLPLIDSDQPLHLDLFKWLVSRNRCGVVELSPKPHPVRDLYLMPLPAKAPVPRVLLPFRGPGLNPNRSDKILGILVISIELLNKRLYHSHQQTQPPQTTMQKEIREKPKDEIKPKEVVPPHEQPEVTKPCVYSELPEDPDIASDLAPRNPRVLAAERRKEEKSAATEKSEDAPFNLSQDRVVLQFAHLDPRLLAAEKRKSEAQEAAMRVAVVPPKKRNEDVTCNPRKDAIDESSLQDLLPPQLDRAQALCDIGLPSEQVEKKAASPEPRQSSTLHVRGHSAHLMQRQQKDEAPVLSVAPQPRGPVLARHSQIHFSGHHSGRGMHPMPMSRGIPPPRFPMHWRRGIPPPRFPMHWRRGIPPPRFPMHWRRGIPPPPPSMPVDFFWQWRRPRANSDPGSFPSDNRFRPDELLERPTPQPSLQDNKPPALHAVILDEVAAQPKRTQPVQLRGHPTAPAGNKVDPPEQRPSPSPLVLLIQEGSCKESAREGPPTRVPQQCASKGMPQDVRVRDAHAEANLKRFNDDSASQSIENSVTTAEEGEREEKENKSRDCDLIKEQMIGEKKRNKKDLLNEERDIMTSAEPNKEYQGHTLLVIEQRKSADSVEFQVTEKKIEEAHPYSMKDAMVPQSAVEQESETPGGMPAQAHDRATNNDAHLHYDQKLIKEPEEEKEDLFSSPPVQWQAIKKNLTEPPSAVANQLFDHSEKDIFDPDQAIANITAALEESMLNLSKNNEALRKRIEHQRKEFKKAKEQDAEDIAFKDHVTNILRNPSGKAGNKAGPPHQRPSHSPTANLKSCKEPASQGPPTKIFAKEKLVSALPEVVNRDNITKQAKELIKKVKDKHRRCAADSRKAAWSVTRVFARAGNRVVVPLIGKFPGSKKKKTSVSDHKKQGETEVSVVPCGDSEEKENNWYTADTQAVPAVVATTEDDEGLKEEKLNAKPCLETVSETELIGQRAVAEIRSSSGMSSPMQGIHARQRQTHVEEVIEEVGRQERKEMSRKEKMTKKQEIKEEKTDSLKDADKEDKIQRLEEKSDYKPIGQVPWPGHLSPDLVHIHREDDDALRSNEQDLSFNEDENEEEDTVTENIGKQTKIEAAEYNPAVCSYSSKILATQDIDFRERAAHVNVEERVGSKSLTAIREINSSVTPSMQSIHARQRKCYVINTMGYTSVAEQQSKRIEPKQCEQLDRIFSKESSDLTNETEDLFQPLTSDLFQPLPSDSLPCGLLLSSETLSSVENKDDSDITFITPCLKQRPKLATKGDQNIKTEDICELKVGNCLVVSKPPQTQVGKDAPILHLESKENEDVREEEVTRAAEDAKEMEAEESKLAERYTDCSKEEAPDYFGLKEERSEGKKREEPLAHNVLEETKEKRCREEKSADDQSVRPVSLLPAPDPESKEINNVASVNLPSLETEKSFFAEENTPHSQYLRGMASRPQEFRGRPTRPPFVRPLLPRFRRPVFSGGPHPRIRPHPYRSYHPGFRGGPYPRPRPPPPFWRSLVYPPTQ